MSIDIIQKRKDGKRLLIEFKTGRVQRLLFLNRLIDKQRGLSDKEAA